MPDTRVETIAGWMTEDVRRCIDQDARFLAVLGIMVYIEAIKRLEKANLPATYMDRDAFIDGFVDMGYETAFATNILERVRHKMAHIYVAFGDLEIKNDIAPLGSKGISDTRGDGLGKLTIYLKTLYIEFENEIERIRLRIVGNPNIFRMAGSSLDSIGATTYVIANVSGSTVGLWPT